jgi:predicted amidohydrolase
MLAACLQLHIELCRPEENLGRALQMAESALSLGAQILVLPELFLSGFCHEPYAQDFPPFPSLDPLRALVQEHGCLIIGSLHSGRQNLGFCLEKEGLEVRPKIHPFGSEKEHFDGGSFISPIATGWGMIGLQICYDLRFPEVARLLALQGADFLVTIAQFPPQRRSQWRTLCLARAIENQFPHLACNWAQGGGSLIIDARGEALSEAGEEECLILGEIYLAARDEIRREIPCLADRRPDIY